MTNNAVIETYIKQSFKTISVRKTILTSLLFFIRCGILAKSLIPAHAGRKTTNGKQRSGIKRVHRFLCNKLLTTEQMENIYLNLIKILTKGLELERVTLALDWTVIKEKYNFLSASLVLGQGHSIPLFFAGYKKGTLTAKRNQTCIEKETVQKIVKALGFVNKMDKITLLFDRGFDSPGFISFLQDLQVKYVVRVSSQQWIATQKGNEFKLSPAVIVKGKEKRFFNIRYTKTNPITSHLYVKWARNQKEPWFLLSNIKAEVSDICKFYATRWEIEEMFKSLKNQAVGFDIKEVRLRDFDRWLRLLLVATILFQALGTLGGQLRQVDKLEQYYSASSKPPKNQRYIFSIFSLAMHVLSDHSIEIKYRVSTGFQIKLLENQWKKLGVC